MILKSILARTAALLVVVSAAQGASSITQWVPIFQGIDQANGTNEGTGAVALSVNACA